MMRIGLFGYVFAFAASGTSVVRTRAEKTRKVVARSCRIRPMSSSPAERDLSAFWPIGFALRNRIKSYSLSKRQVSREVHRVGRTAHVPFPCIRSRFAAAARSLFPAERAADLRAACAYVHVGDPTVASRSAKKVLRFSEVVGENR